MNLLQVGHAMLKHRMLALISATSEAILVFVTSEAPRILRRYVTGVLVTQVCVSKEVVVSSTMYRGTTKSRSSKVATVQCKRRTHLLSPSLKVATIQRKPHCGKQGVAGSDWGWVCCKQVRATM